MDYRKSKRLFEICLYVGLGLILVTAVIKFVLWPLILGGIILLGGITQAGIFYRCPHCHKSLDFRGKDPKFCPECGGKLFDGR